MSPPRIAEMSSPRIVEMSSPRITKTCSLQKGRLFSFQTSRKHVSKPGFCPGRKIRFPFMKNKEIAVFLVKRHKILWGLPVCAVQTLSGFAIGTMPVTAIKFLWVCRPDIVRATPEQKVGFRLQGARLFFRKIRKGFNPAFPRRKPAVYRKPFRKRRSTLRNRLFSCARRLLSAEAICRGKWEAECGR